MKDSLGYTYSIRRTDLLKRKRVGSIVDKGNPYSTDNIKVWLILNNKDFVLCENSLYISNKEKMKFYHDIPACQEYFNMSWNNLSQGNQGCPVCCGQQVGVKTSLAYLRPDLAIEWDYSKNGLLPENITPCSNRKVWWLCSICKKSWIISPNARNTNNSGCPSCNFSKGELKMSKFFDLNKILYVSEYTFEDCRNKLKLPFDFYLPDFNLCVEYDGILHYKDKFNNPKEFKNLKKNDKIKTKYCKDNNINLLRIPYWEFDNIEKILSEALL